MTFSLARYTPNNMNLKPTHKAVKDYYTVLDQYARLGITNEGRRPLRLPIPPRILRTAREMDACSRTLNDGPQKHANLR